MKMNVMTSTRRGVAGSAAALLLVLAGCGVSAPSGDGQLSVVASAYPFQFIAERVAGTHATVSNLTAPGTEPHDLELTPKQVGSLSDAGLVVYERGFQPAVDEAISQSGTDKVLDTTTVVPLEPLAESADHPDEHGDDHGADHGADHGHDHADGEGGLDPHVWLDPTKVIIIADAVANKLAAIDPAHADAYRENATALRGELEALDNEFRSGLTGCQRTDFITSHAAFGYLAQRYDLTQIAVSGLSPDAEPSPARIAEIQTEAKDHAVTTIFTETLVSPAVAEAIAGDLGLRTDVLDPIEGITDSSRGRDYLAIMQANLTALQKANGCPVS